MKALIFFAVLVVLTISTWLFIPLLQGRDADFETRLALLQGRGGDFVATPSEATPTPPSQAPEAAPSRALLGPAESVETGRATGKAAETSIREEGATTKVAEAPPAPPADRPGSADMDSARAEQLPTPGTEPSEDPLPRSGGRHGAAPASEAAASAQSARDRQLVAGTQSGLKRMGYDPGPIDGILGPRTRAAIRAYQKDHGLAVDERPTQALALHIQAQLGDQVGGGERGTPRGGRDAGR